MPSDRIRRAFTRTIVVMTAASVLTLPAGPAFAEDTICLNVLGKRVTCVTI